MRMPEQPWYKVDPEMCPLASLKQNFFIMTQENHFGVFTLNSALLLKACSCMAAPGEEHQRLAVQEVVFSFSRAWSSMLYHCFSTSFSLYFGFANQNADSSLKYTDKRLTNVSQFTSLALGKKEKKKKRDREKKKKKKS